MAVSALAGHSAIQSHVKDFTMQTLIRNSLAVLLIAASTAPATLSAAAQEAPRVHYQEIPEGAYSVVAQVRAKPGKGDMLRAATLPLIDLVRSDPKNLIYFLQEDRAKPGHFIFYEVFASQADFDAHNAMPYVKDWFAKLPELADGGVEVMRMAVLGKPKK
ncbi:putative quinol monooxygenase [Bradyrhizobium sp. CB1015]|uniref:putative quinol monooxygenase n=1 Tax=Bradyrhizobium sp. CB1015 TaxID=2976822 RepID=UPI0021AB009E|nr:putative quinol monooxygenase [Bradyrhizobium sp. CB1015]UWU95297.1 antibiotic biosynthesis monooxygenase [Bradyrhizobium sp. CB1015]